MEFGDAGYPGVVPRVAWFPGETEQGFLTYKAQGRMVLDLLYPMDIWNLKILKELKVKFKSRLKRKYKWKYDVSVY